MLMSGYSGANSELRIENEEAQKVQELISRENELLAQLALKTLEWDQSKNEAKEARQVRDQYCLSLEEKYKVPPGAKWDIDFKKGVIVLMDDPVPGT